MMLVDKAWTVAQLARAGYAWLRHDTAYPSPVPESAKFMSARDAVALIRDGDVVAESGLGAHQRASIVYWAMREAFEQSGHPADLTVVNVGGHGGRGRAPGTLDELGRPGLCTRFITSHFETFHDMLALADAGRCELQCLPLGVLVQLFVALGRGRDSVVSATGVGTFLDPRVGRGSPVTTPAGEQLIVPYGRRLRYRLPRIDVAIFNLPAADRHGNLYAKNTAIVGESVELARAARRNGGRVIANVGLVVDEGYDAVALPADMVDAVVYHPDTEQTGGFFHRAHWPAMTTASDVAIADALERVRFINWLARISPQRGAADDVVARLAAATLLANVERGGLVSIGTGMPEEVCRVVYESGHLDALTFALESGVVGGLPAPGIYFGAALSPREIVSSAELFRRCDERLDATCLGVLQADGRGNVNVSKRGDGPRGYVGPGGFIDFAAAAETIVFVSTWTHRGERTFDGTAMRITRHGTPKFVEQVDEVTFNGPLALRAGKKVFYATDVGLFRLSARGMELDAVLPGIDLRHDILEVTAMKIALPASGRVPVVPRSVVTGERLTGGPHAPRERRASRGRGSGPREEGRTRKGR